MASGRVVGFWRTPKPAVTKRPRVRKSASAVLLVGSVVAGTLIPEAAFAQVQPGCASTLPATYTPFTQIIGGVVGAANSITSVIGTMNTAFQAQGDAFVVGVPNASPDQTAGGTWGRAIGGRADNHATGTFNGVISAGTAGFSSGFPGGAGATGAISCQSDIRQDYAGFQLGQDLARLNLSGGGATFHAGITGGYAQSQDQDLSGSGFTGGFKVPFVGVYAAYTNGNFFADALLRGDYYQMNLTAAPAALGNQNLDAFGFSETVSAGYKIELGNNWFLEPSVSGIHSSTKVDTLLLPGGAGNTFDPLYPPPATVQFGTIESLLGRAGAEVGTTFTGGNVVWEPFATASVWHEFAGNISATYSASPFFAGNSAQLPLAPCALVPAAYPNGCGNAISGTVSGTRVGTYGQYSVGVFGLITGTPWLGYLRLDYKDGANLEAMGFNAGLRYQFDPTQHPAAAGLYKAPPRPASYDWTGFYVGGVTGAALGRTNWSFPQTGTSADPMVGGVVGGGTLGYNKQLDRWIVGVEGDLVLSNATGGQACQDGINNVNVTQNCNDSLRALATVAGRVGYTPLDRLLLFAKVGGAWTNNALDASCNGDAFFFQGGCFPTNNSFGSVQDMTLTDRRFGGLLGAGFELALTPVWSAKVEYDYLDFGSKSLVLADTTPVTVREYFNALKFGLNYHFNGKDLDAAAPVAAMPVKAPPPPRPSDWTGGYAGLEADYRLAETQWNTANIPGFAPLATANGVVLPDLTTNLAQFFSATAQGGAFVGYDRQLLPRWVAGIEGDASFGNSSMSRGGIPGTYGNGSATGIQLVPGIEAEQADTATVKFGWSGSARARLGYLSTPNVLLYGTGGIAFQQVSVGAMCNGTIDSFCRFTVPRSDTVSTVASGWTIGGGLESILTGNWLGKVEFRYADFAHISHSFFAGTVDEVDANVHPQTYTFLAGVGYKFNGKGSLIAP